MEAGLVSAPVYAPGTYTLLTSALPSSLASGPSVVIHDKTAIEMDKYMTQQDGDDDDDSEEGPRHQFYTSERILGQLYRAVDEQKIWAEDIKMQVSHEAPPFWDQLLAGLLQRVNTIGPVEWRHRSGEAQRIRHA